MHERAGANPEPTEPRPRRASPRIVLAVALLAIGIAFVLYAPGPAIGVLAAGSIAIPLAVAYRNYRRVQRALRARFAVRPRLDVRGQARDLLESRGLPAGERSVALLASRWREVGDLLGINPEQLRASDNLRADFGPLGDGYIRHAVEWEVVSRGRAGAVAGERAPVAATACMSCGYDLRGLPEEAVCPECGQAQQVIRTLGDYLVFACRLVPAACTPPATDR